MDSPTNVAVGSSIQQPHNALAATTQLWLDMEIPANSSASPRAMEVDADVGADPQSTNDDQHPVDPLNLTVTPSKITLPCRFTEGEFLGVPVAWFSDQESPDADEMSE